MIQMLRPPMEPDSKGTLPYGALVRSQINISKPIDWLNLCQKHARMLPNDRRVLRNPDDMRLIDVLHHCIVPAQERASYVALSYVRKWASTHALNAANLAVLREPALEPPIAMPTTMLQPIKVSVDDVKSSVTTPWAAVKPTTSTSAKGQLAKTSAVAARSLVTTQRTALTYRHVTPVVSLVAMPKIVRGDQSAMPAGKLAV